MKHFTFSLLFFFCSTFLVGQSVVYTPTEVFSAGVETDYSIDGSFDMMNPGSEDVEFIWKLERTDVPAEWSFIICDNILCYAPGTEECPDTDDAANKILAGESVEGKYKITLLPNNVAYTGYVTFNAYQRGNPSNIYGSLKVNFDVDMVSSTDDFDQEDIVVYPNPSADFFQVKNDENVNSLSVFNIVGKEIKNYKHVRDRVYDVSNFESGMYLIRFFDNESNAIKTSRLTIK